MPRWPLPARFLCALALPSILAGCGGGDATLSRGPDPDSAVSAFARPGGALAWPGAKRAFEVRADGSLENGAWVVVPEATADGVGAGAPRRIAAEERWRPVLRWNRSAGAVRFEFEAVAFPGLAESTLCVSLAVRAVNTGTAAADVRYGCRIERPGLPRAWVANDAPATDEPLPGWDEGARGVAGIAPGGPAGAPRWHITLAPAAEHTWRVVLAAHAAPRRALAGLAGTSHQRRVAEARRYWNDATGGGLQLALGDPETERAVRAALVVLLLCRERSGTHWVPTGGPFQYHDVWLRDGARVVAALAVAGHGREARELADGLTIFQWPMGPFVSQRGQLDGNGQAVWAFAQAVLRPAADTTVARYAELALSSAQWLETQRRLGAWSRMTYGPVLPFAEPRDAELTRAQLVGNDAWAIAGLDAGARLLRAAHRESEARHLDSLRAAHAATFVAALARTGRADIPPSWQGPGFDWGNLAVGWPCRALPAGDPHLAALAARVWNAAGGEGLTCYGAPDSLHGYVGADLGTWALLADRPADAERVLAALLRWRDATGASAELFSRSARDYGRNLPPHPTAAAAIVQLVRNMLVYDDGDALLLTLGARERWWRGARLEGAPTRWGTLALRFERRASRAHWQWSAVPVWTALTLPPGTVLAAAPGAPLLGRPGGRAVLAPPGTTQASVPLRAAPEARP